MTLNPQQFVGFDQLPRPARKAAFEYMVEPHDEEDVPWEQVNPVRGARLGLRRLKNDWEFAHEEIPMDEAKRLVMEKSPTLKKDHGDFDNYHEWYKSHGDVPDHTERWPSIVSDYPDELFEDGWHRFHSYVKQGHPTVPVLHIRKRKP